MQPPSHFPHARARSVPLLSGVAKTVLEQVVSASAAERNWSIYGKIKDESRNRLSHSKSDKIVYCHEALHLQDMAQDAGYKAPVEKWDSDSDSDESDDEEDLKV